MSNAALTWAWPIPIKGPKKIVLIALAEHADAEGACWPSIQRLVLYSGICERAVRSALVDLESAKIITVDRKNGRAGRAGNHYLLDMNTAPDTFLNKAPYADLPTVSPKTIRHLLPENKASPAENKAPHSENKAPHAPEPLEPSRTLKEPSLSGASAPTPKPAKRQSRIPADWKPDDKGISFANDRSVDIRAEIPKFRDRHQAKGSLMADWSAAWRTWCQSPYVTKVGMPRAGPARQTAASAWAERYGLLDNTPASNMEFDIEGVAE